jgi:hypothetical protein
MKTFGGCGKKNFCDEKSVIFFVFIWLGYVNVVNLLEIFVCVCFVRVSFFGYALTGILMLLL